MTPKERSLEVQDALKDVIMLLKLANIHAIGGSKITPTSTKIHLSVQPITRLAPYKETALLNVNYKSIEGLRKGVSKILLNRSLDPTYLELPEGDEFFMEFNGFRQLVRRRQTSFFG